MFFPPQVDDVRNGPRGMPLQGQHGFLFLAVIHGVLEIVFVAYEIERGRAFGHDPVGLGPQGAFGFVDFEAFFAPLRDFPGFLIGVSHREKSFPHVFGVGVAAGKFVRTGSTIRNWLVCQPCLISSCVWLLVIVLL
jgi:hypothetical protein